MIANLQAARRNIRIAYYLARGRWPYDYQLAFWRDTRRLTTYNKSRDTGFSEAGAFKFFYNAWQGIGAKEKMLMSTSKRQSQHLRQYVREFIDSLGLQGELDLDNETIIRFKNHFILVFLPQSPSSVRTYHGDVLLDEAAHFTQGRAIREAVIPFIGRGYSLTAISTPFGEDGLFYPLWTNRMYSQTTIHHSRCPDLLTIDPEFKMPRIEVIRRSMDEDSYQQEYCNQFLDEASAFLPSTLILACTDEEMPFLTHVFRGYVDPDELDNLVADIANLQPTRAGMDYGAKMDASEIMFCRKEGGKDKLVANVSLQYVKYTIQEQIARKLAGLCPDGFYVDATGPGAGIAQHLEDATGNATGVTFNSKTKETLALDLKRAMQDGKLTIPEDRPLATQLHSIKRTKGQSAFRYDTDRGQGHHADKFWALAMAISEGIRGGAIEFSAWNP